MPVSYIICAAGQGTRTAEISKTIPKPLLRLKGKSLLKRSIESLPIEKSDQLLVLHSSSMTVRALEQELSEWKNRCEVKTQVITELTRGQLETAWLGLGQVPDQNSVAVFNSDTFFSCPTLLQDMKSKKWDGLIPCGREEGTAWSFCEVENTSENPALVTQVAEKERISEWCSVGFYWFSTKELFAKYAAVEMNLRAAREIYVAPMYNLLLQDHLRIGMNKVDRFLPMGSVEQIERYWGVGLAQMREENLSR